MAVCSNCELLHEADLREVERLEDLRRSLWLWWSPSADTYSVPSLSTELYELGCARSERPQHHFCCQEEQLRRHLADPLQRGFAGPDADEHSLWIMWFKMLLDIDKSKRTARLAQHVEDRLTAAKELPPGLRAIMRNLEYVDDVDDDLVCGICRSPFLDPCALDCAHVFCRDCITEALPFQPEGAQCCPLCRVPTDKAGIRAAEKSLRNRVDGLLAKCPWHERGCTVTFTAREAALHARDCCKYRVRCPDCEETVFDGEDHACA